MKKMTPKERAMAFFRNEPVDELPTDEGLFVLFNPEAYKERPSHVHGGVDWFGVPWKYESSVDAIAPDHTVDPIMEDICDWRELVKFPDLDAWDWSKVEEIDHISEIDRENKVFEIIKSRLFYKDTPLTMESKLEDDLWMDSLDEVEILMELEKEFGILIPNDDPGRCLTVKDVVDYMIRRMEE